MGGVGERFVINSRQARDYGKRIIRRNHQLRVFSPQVTGNPLSVLALIEFSFSEANGKGLHPRRGLVLHESDNRRRIYAPGKESAEGYIRHHLLPYRVTYQSIQLSDGLPGVFVMPLATAGAEDTLYRPEWFGLGAGLRAFHHQHVSCRKLEAILPDRVGCGNIIVS